LSTKLTKIRQIFNLHHFVLVVTESQQYNDNNTISKKQMVVGIITRIDLLNYIVSKNKISKDKNDNDDTQDIE